MGWSRGLNHLGEEVGYSVPATCSEDGCDKAIDRGLAYTCGGLDGHDGTFGCGRPFCESHLVYAYGDDDEMLGDDAVCSECCREAEGETA